jgi:hypothetical protein
MLAEFSPVLLKNVRAEVTVAITLAQLRDKLGEFLADLDRQDSTTLAKVWEFLKYSVENYEDLDDNARAYIDGVFEKLRREILERANAQPDSKEKRRLLRQIGLAGREHVLATGLIATLGAPSLLKDPVLPATVEAFSMLLQNVLDILFDVTRRTHRGPASFAQIGLCYWAVDELVCSLHLAQRAFTSQSYAHVRTTFEILDLIELFNKEPQWAEVWAKGDGEKAWAELRPAAVRKKLGSPKFDPVYSLLSELGSHGTFRGLQARSARLVGHEEEDRKKFKISVGGTRDVQHIVWTNTFCVWGAMMLLASCGNVFAEFLNADEMQGMFERTSSVAKEFLNDHFLKWAKTAGLNYQPIEEHLKAHWPSHKEKQ